MLFTGSLLSAIYSLTFGPDFGFLFKLETRMLQSATGSDL